MLGHSCESVCKGVRDCLGNLNQLVCGSTQSECRKIREMYKGMYGEDLVDVLQNDLERNGVEMDQNLGWGSPKACAVVAMLMLSPHERDAVVAREAIIQNQKSGAVNYRALIEIYAGRKSSHFFFIQQAYVTKFRRHLDQDIISIEPPHPYQKLLMALAASQRAHSADISQHIAKCDAQRLYHAGEGVIDEAVVLEILSKRSIPQLKHTFLVYKRIYGHSYVKSLEGKHYGEFKEALKVVVEFMSDPPKWYAKVLYASLLVRTTGSGELSRVMVSRAEIDMNEIQRAYKNKYGMELVDAITKSVSAGDYRDLLVALATKLPKD